MACYLVPCFVLPPTKTVLKTTAVDPMRGSHPPVPRNQVEWGLTPWPTTNATTPETFVRKFLPAILHTRTQDRHICREIKPKTSFHDPSPSFTILHHASHSFTILHPYVTFWPTYLPPSALSSRNCAIQAPPFATTLPAHCRLPSAVPSQGTITPCLPPSASTPM